MGLSQGGTLDAKTGATEWWGLVVVPLQPMPLASLAPLGAILDDHLAPGVGAATPARHKPPFS